MPLKISTIMKRNIFVSLVLFSKDLTFYGNYKLGYYRKYFLTPSSSQEIINALVGTIIEADFDLTIFFTTWTAKKTYGC